MQAEPLKQLVYTSTAMIEPQVILTPAFIERLQEKNRQLGITGTLAWRQNNFMQIMEGPSSAIYADYPPHSIGCAALVLPSR